MRSQDARIRPPAHGRLTGKRRPSKANLDRIDAAYLTVRRQNVANHLLRRLNAGGGTRGSQRGPSPAFGDV
ncbi:MULTISPECIES: hypothetical protein [Streptomyces]|uniref:hypothetical protein n=1 Tax=Streptomyces TaxID=1883 RepID=UPI00081BB2B3|nr:hypothetical protein GA0115247_114012 [Streptomyces sp. PalvLS-984]SDD53629.1 hypothetical protein F558DRAFT_04299 [Streptomyces sp. AmelKG-A3]